MLGLGPDRVIASVSTDRAYAMMARGFAVQDKRFMSLYAANNPKSEPVKSAAKTRETATRKPKREKAVEVKDNEES